LTSDVYEVSITEGGTTVNSEHEGGEKFLRSLLSLSVAKSSTAVEDVQTWKGIEKWEPILRKVTKDRIYSLLVHPTQDKVLCAAGDKDGRIGFWDATSNSVHVFRPHVKSVAALAWGSGSSQSGTTLLSAAYDGQLRSIDLAHDTEKGVEFDVFYEDHDGNMLSSLVVSKDGNLAYVGL
jgi:WD40 repeat protein